MNYQQVRVPHNFLADLGWAVVRNVNHVHRIDVLEDPHCHKRNFLYDRVLVLRLLKLSREDLVEQTTLTLLNANFVEVVQSDGGDGKAFLHDPEEFLVEYQVVCWLEDGVKLSEVERNGHVLPEKVHEFYFESRLSIFKHVGDDEGLVNFDGFIL